MERWTPKDHRNARIGIALASGLAALCVLIFFIDAIVQATVEGPRITLTAERAPGISRGTTVWVAGRPVGRVLSVDFLPPEDGTDRIVIAAVLERGVDRILRSDAHAILKAGGLLEPIVVAINPGTGSLPRWDLDRPLPSGRTTVTPERLLEMARTLADGGTELADQAARLRRHLVGGTGTLARLAAEPEVLRETAEVMTRLDSLVQGGHLGGTVGRLITDTTIEERLHRIRDRLVTLDTLHARERAVASYEETAGAVAAFQERLARLSGRLDAGEGSAGRFLRDGALGRQTALLRARIDSLTVELMKQPDRWLRVKIF